MRAIFAAAAAVVAFMTTSILNFFFQLIFQVQHPHTTRLSDQKEKKTQLQVTALDKAVGGRATPHSYSHAHEEGRRQGR